MPGAGAIALLAIATGAGCGERESATDAGAPLTGTTIRVEPAPPPARSGSGGAGDAARAEAEQIFATRCATCHGPDGAGNGPAAAALDPKPRDFRDASWQASVSDAHVEKIIQYGGAALGRSAAMAPNPDLVSRPELVAALRAKVRSLGGR